jgi:ferritin-like metal-binding protein YciE
MAAYLEYLRNLTNNSIMKEKMNAFKTALTKTKAIPKSSKETLEDIFEDMLKDIYWSEKHIIKALPKMSKASHNEQLKDAFELRLEEIQLQIQRVENCFELLEKKAATKKCEAMEGLVKEAQEAIEHYEDGHARDAALIAAAQKVEHYEISAYSTMRTMAAMLGKVQCAELLEETKDEVAETDIKLTDLAEKINQLAAELEEEEVE